MAGFVSKQPNEFYCRFSIVTDSPTAWNMTREDYINMIMQEAKEVVETLENKGFLVVDDDENDTVNKIWHVLKNVENQ